MQGSSFIRLLILAIFALIGTIIGILLVPALTENGTPFIVSALTLTTIVIIIIALRFYRMKEKKIINSSDSPQKGSEVGFVVDTFHDLVGKLKEKEQELDRLKALAEEKASSIEAYNENVLQSVPSGVVSIDNSMIIKSINQAAENILGISVQDSIGKNATEILNEPLITVVREGQRISRGEYQYRTNDNRHIWLGITTSILKNASNEKIGMIYVFTDLSDIKALQSQVELKQRLSQLGEMSAGIAHELRNSMSVISGYIKLLSKKINDVGQPTIGSIQTEIQNMDRIISELLAFAKPSDINLSKVNVKDLMEQSIASLLINSSIKLSLNSDDTVCVKADEILLKQALSNLILNAIESMPRGGNLDIKIGRIKEKVEIYLRDTGCGIPKDKIQKIFLPFYTTKEEGIGFGLALVHKIIVSHDGSIEVNSREGEGTEFRLTLPADE